MTNRFETVQQSILAFAGALFFTAILVSASAPAVVIA